MGTPSQRDLVTEGFSAYVAKKARKLIKDGMLRQDAEHPSIWWVGATTSETKDVYRVEIREPISSCSCRHGLNHGTGAKCSHVLAAIWLAQAQADLSFSISPAPLRGDGGK